MSSPALLLREPSASRREPHSSWQNHLRNQRIVTILSNGVESGLLLCFNRMSKSLVFVLYLNDPILVPQPYRRKETLKIPSWIQEPKRPKIFTGCKEPNIGGVSLRRRK